jgi:hypothetical protein
MKGKLLSAEDMAVLKKVIERSIVKDGLLKIGDVEGKIAKALKDSCQPGLSETERLRLQTLIELGHVYIEVLNKRITYLANCYSILFSVGDLPEREKLDS